MKKIKLILLTVLAATFLFSCKSSKKELSTPENATKTFVQAFYTADFDELYKCTAQNNRPIIQQIQKMTNNQKEQLEKMRKNEIIIRDVKCLSQNDSVAECECQFLFNKEEKKLTYNLRKEEEDWHVDLTIQY